MQKCRSFMGYLMETLYVLRRLTSTSPITRRVSRSPSYHPRVPTRTGRLAINAETKEEVVDD